MAKKIKLRDKTGEQLIPVTRSTTVEMNDGVTLQTAYEGINSSHYTKEEINEMGYLQNYTETDPTVPTHVKSITEQNITNWNNAVLYDGADRNSATLQTLNIQGSKTSPANPSVIFTGNNVEFTGTNIKSILVNNSKNYKFNRDVNGDVAILSDFNSYVSKSELSSAGYLTSFAETDPIYSASAAAGITSSDITNWNNKLSEHQDLSSYVKWVEKNEHEQNTNTLSANVIVLSSSTDRYIYGNGGIRFDDAGLRLVPNGNNELMISDVNDDTTQYYFREDKRGDVAITNDITKAINSYVISASYISTSSLNTTLSSYATSANYDSNTKKIYLKHGTTTLSEIDATDFIKDGMVDTAYVQGANLVISFNTDAGKEAVNVPITNIFNANNYYTKSEIDNAGYLTSHQDLSSYVKWNKNYAEMLNINVIDDIDRLMFNSSSGQYLTTKNNKLGIGNSGDTDVISFPDFTGSNRTIACVDQFPDMSSYVSKTDLNSAGYITSFTETDPTVPTHVKSITQQNITDWNNKLSSETQLSKGTTTGSGNAVTDISVSNHQITLTKGSTFLTSHQDIKTINNQTITGTGNVTINELPTVSSSDNGKVLQVVNGQWQLVTPTTIYSGTGTPDNSQGNNGDLYIQT